MSRTRRRFLKDSLVTTTSMGVALGAGSRVLGANDDIRVAVIGLNGRGKSHINYSRGRKGIKLVAVCDPDRKVLDSRAKSAEKDLKHEVEQIVDFRKVLDRQDIDAVTIATPNHLHSLIGVLAAQAGKDVYVEKPVSHNIWEGRQLANASAKYGRIIQTGTQSRSNPGMQQMVQYIREGHLGKVKSVVGTCFKRRGSIGKLSEPLKIPEHIDYDLWCGPADKVDLMRPRLHYDWHWDFNTGNGDLGNQGIHQMDLARWFLGAEGLSPQVMSVGGRLGYEDAANTANTQFVYHDYPDAPLIFEVRGLPKDASYLNARIGVVVHCEEGYLVAASYHSGHAFDKNGKKIKPFSGGGDHFGNFFDCMRSRKREKLNADVEEGHLSSALCHMGNVSYQMGKKTPSKQIAEQIRGSHAAAEAYGRMSEHLKANGVKLDGPVLTMGPMLKLDPKTEQFSDPRAQKLAKRTGRKPFEVPEIGVKGLVERAG
ncbi:MAG: Gfo/Idh/MocA family oxidoreductase [Phycisphaerae bacterium]|nr:Gfo/Idh/MocA family oxidoreductase [Phycisphaerae bacterium]